jgi:hypothetical protein
MQARETDHCERSGRLIGHCGCSDCYARRLAKLVHDDPTLRAASESRQARPRDLVADGL